MRYFLILFLVITGFVFNPRAFGQIAIANGSAQARIVEPINILKVRDLNFGIISPGETSGTVVLAPTEAGNRTASGGVTLPTGSGTVNSAKFIVSGADGYSYSIVLPTIPVILSNGTETMTIDNFTSTPSGSGTFTPGSQTICVGAMLNVAANQQPGLYESIENFEVIVNYN